MLKRSASYLLSTLAAVAIAGCQSAGYVPPPPPVTGTLQATPGTYNGVTMNTSGAPQSGTASLTFDSGGYAVLTTASGKYTGTLSGNTLTVKSASGLTLTGTVAKTGTYWTLTYSENDTSKSSGLFPFGQVPDITKISGTFTGTYTSSDGTSGTIQNNISSTGQVGSAIMPTGFGASGGPGSVDINGNMFIHYYNTKVSHYEILSGPLNLSGSTLTGTLMEVPSGNTLTINETKM